MMQAELELSDISVSIQGSKRYETECLTVYYNCWYSRLFVKAMAEKRIGPKTEP